jgi:hypothetical protein
LTADFEGDSMNPLTVLLMSYYREDTRTLLAIAEELRRVAPVRPLFFIASGGELRDEAAKLVRAAGFDLFEGLPDSDMAAGRGVRNPFREFAIVREANRSLARRILERTSPAAIVCTIDASRNYFVQVAGELGIPSLYVQWAEIEGPEFHRAWWRAETRWADRSHRPLKRLRRRVVRMVGKAAGFGQRWPFFTPATRLAVAGPFYRDMCIRAGIPPERIAVTGNVQGDEMSRCSRMTAGEIAAVKRSLGLAESKRFLLYALNDTARLVHLDPGSAEETERTILTAMRAAQPGFARVIKLHPKQGDEDAARIRAVDPDAIVVGEGWNVGELIAASSAVVATVSSVLLWAVGIGRPSISTYLWRGADEMRMARGWTGVEFADSFDALMTALRGNIEDPNHIAEWQARRREGRERYLTLDGRGVARIVEALLALLPEGAAAPERAHSALGAHAAPRAGTEGRA